MPDPHSTDNYTLGKGILSIAEWDGTSPPTSPDFWDVGNCPSMEVEPTIEKLPHYSSRSGLRYKDKNPVIQTEYVVNFDLDEVAAKNLAVFLMGTKTDNVVSALNQTDKEYALKFVSDNPVGPNAVWEFWRATISPNGPIQLIGEEWLTMSYMAEGLADTANHASSPYLNVTYATTTTTTTTTT
jgi:hypothetical protein